MNLIFLKLIMNEGLDWRIENEGEQANGRKIERNFW